MKQGVNFKRLVIAAYRLPFNFTLGKTGKYKAVQNSGGLVSAILSLSEKFKSSENQFANNKIVWAGMADNLPEDVDAKLLKNKHFDLCPIQISKELDTLYYGGFCNDLIWPLFHYFPSFSVFDSEYFKAYEEANAIFCKELLKTLKPDDFLWIHDYQLLLLPEMIRQQMPEVNIGFFLHIPFPSFEIFRIIPRPWREKIIHGMLGADLVGFHTHDYTQNFLKSVRRTTGYECKQNIIFTPRKTVKADAFPIGIDYHKFHDSCLLPAIVKEKEKIKEHLLSAKLIFSVDRLDYSKGLLYRLKGYETFLERYPQFHSKVVFNMVVVPSRDSIERYKEMKKEIEFTVGRINGKYSSLSWRPIIYQYKSLHLNELIALYDLSDVGLITPLRDGMNLVAKEYIASQVEHLGVLILSEMTGAAAELNEAIVINPFDNNEMAEAICHALEMPSEEKKSRLLRMQNRIESYNVFTWAFDFFNQLREVKLYQNMMSVRFLNKGVTTNIKENYLKSVKRILFLDYDGTLVAFAKYPELAVLELSTLDIVQRLVADPQNQVVIISGRDRDFLDKQFSSVNVSLIAEHGFFVKHAGGNWEMSIQADVQWKDTVKPILMEYVDRCNGTFIEEKTGSIAWHFRNADSDFAQLRLNELRDELAEIIRHKTEFEILEGNKVLEIKSGRYDKGTAALKFLSEADCDFILAAGDDKTDEFLFKALPGSAYSIKIGLSPSVAKYNVANFSLFLKFLRFLSE